MTDVSADAPAPDPKKTKATADAPAPDPVVVAPAPDAEPSAPTPEEIQAMVAAGIKAALAAKAAEDDAADRAKRDAALPGASAVQRQLDDEAAAVAASGTVTCRVLKAGDGKVSKGHPDTATGADAVFARGDELTLPRLIAEALEDRGFVEIQEPA